MSVDPLNLPFAEALRYLRAKVNVPTKGWRDLLKEEHDQGFMVAGAMKADLLMDLRTSVDRAISDGKSLEWFQKNFMEIAARHGWDYVGTPEWRARVILETNILTSYSAGRYAQMTTPEMLKARPYWRWVHGDSVHPRPQHLAWNGMVLPADDPFWQAHYPPCGWGCRCRVFNLSADDVEARGLTILKAPPPPLGPAQKGEVLPGVDEGFDYTPGKSVVERLRPIIEQKARGLVPAISTDLRRELQAWLDAG